MHISFDEYSFEGNAWYGDGCAHRLVEENTGAGLCIGTRPTGKLDPVPDIEEHVVAAYLLKEEESVISEFIEAVGDHDDSDVFRLMDWSTFLWELHKFKAVRGIKP